MKRPVEFHKPVLCKELQEFARRWKTGVFVDATVGHAGHARLLAQMLNNADTFLGLDVDPQCLEIAKEKLEDLNCKVCLVRENFGNLARVLNDLNIDNTMMLDCYLHRSFIRPTSITAFVDAVFELEMVDGFSNDRRRRAAGE